MDHPLRQLRTELGLTLEEVSSIVGVTTPSYWRIEKGLRFPRPQLLHRILRFASRHGRDLTADELLSAHLRTIGGINPVSVGEEKERSE
jgi:transcriptional regulator with XRE-family HTH domain